MIPTRSGQRQAPSVLGRVLVLVLGLAALAAGSGALIWSVKGRARLERAGEAALERDFARARELYQQAGGVPWYADDAREGLALVELLEGRLDEARSQLAAIEGKTRPPAPLEELVHGWLETGEYLPMELYVSHRRRQDPDSLALRLWAGLAANGLGRLAEARELLAEGPLEAAVDAVRRGRENLLGPPLKTPRSREVYRRHLQSLELAEQSGERVYLFDRIGRPLAARVLADGKRKFFEPAAEDALLGPGGQGGLEAALADKDRLNRIETTLDVEIQRRVKRSIRNHNAAAVVIDSDGGVVAAAVARSRGRKGREPADPLSDLVELASVTKLFTLSAALSEPTAVEDVLPLTCNKPLMLEGAPFRCWLDHGEITSVEQALAVSCNMTFARLGLEVGAEPVLAALGRAGLGRDPGPAAGPIKIGPLPAAPTGERELARLASGLAPVSTSLAHAAAAALAFGRAGEYVAPHLIVKRVTLGGHVYDAAAPERWTLAPPGVAAGVTRAMRAAVEDPAGTLVRLRVEGQAVAGKSGTSGSSKTGLDGIIVGFVPADEPRFAFAVAVAGEGGGGDMAATLGAEIVKELTRPL